jgi:mRNA-decapping enzyme subunit 2
MIGLDDLCVRFIINLPKEDLSSVARICFQVEEAQWFYEDFIRPLDPTLPSMSLRSFCLRIFQHCPLLASFSVENHMRAFEEFLQYKTRVPVRGAILLNEAMDSTVLVKGWKKGANWSFPRGKINKDEDDLDCAIREVYEETGFDIKAAGLVPKHDEIKYIQIAMREQQIRLYVFRNIPMDTVFQPKTRKEISKIEWYKLSELPAFRKKGSNQADDAAAASNANKFYMVAPFLVPLKKWVIQQKKKDGIRVTSQPHLQAQVLAEEPLTEDDIGMQTEPTAGRSNSPPAIETIEGATLELQRLLKVQPPTQGLQMSPSNPAASNDKGDALMALLRQKSSEPPSSEAPAPPVHAQVPHTPLDLTYVNAPEPPTPHHHHPVQRLQPQNYQAPPPNFPIPHLANQPHQGQHFSYARPHVNITPQSHIYGRNPYMGQGPPPRREPVLLHPQPLPPQVQQSLLVRSILPTPNLPDTTNQKFAQGQYAPPGQFPGQNPVALQQPQQQTAKPPAQLTNHKMSLLNAFKNDTRAMNENKAPNAPPQKDVTPSPGHSAHHGQQSQHGAGSWPNQAPSQPANPAAQYLPQLAAQYAQSSHESVRSQVAPSPGSQPSVSRQGQPTDAHRSSLLDMFKKATPLSPSGSDSTVKPVVVPADPVSIAKSSPVFKTHPAAADINGGSVRASTDTNMSYRPVQILSRQSQQGSPRSDRDQAFANQQMHNYVATSINLMQSDSRNSGHRNLPSPRDRSFLRGESGKGSPRFTLAAQVVQAAGYPYGQSPQQVPQGSASLHQHQPNNALQQRQNSNPEQKQKLLSLFAAKEQASPTGFAIDGKGKAKETGYLEHGRSNTPRPRVASLASAGDNVQSSAPTSRRGSGTPISPADRNFLLSYLESVSSGGR